MEIEGIWEKRNSFLIFNNHERKTQFVLGGINLLLSLSFGGVESRISIFPGYYTFCDIRQTQLPFLWLHQAALG